MFPKKAQMLFLKQLVFFPPKRRSVERKAAAAADRDSLRRLEFNMFQTKRGEKTEKIKF